MKKESKLTWKDGRLIVRGEMEKCIHNVKLTDYCDVCREGV